MLKKSLLFSILNLVFVCTAFSQIAGLYPKDEPIDYKGKTLIVILEDDKIGNPAFDKGLKSEWDITEYEIISLSSFRSNEKMYTGNDRNLFLCFNSDFSAAQIGINAEVRFLTNRIEGKKVKSPAIRKGITLSFDQDYFTDSDIIRLLNNFKAFLLKGATKGITTPAQVIKSKTLLLDATLMEQYGITEEYLKDNYPYPFKIISSEEIAQAIVKKTKGVVFYDYVEFFNYGTRATFRYNSNTQKTQTSYQGTTGTCAFMVYSIEDTAVEWMFTSEGHVVTKGQFKFFFKKIPKGLK